MVGKKFKKTFSMILGVLILAMVVSIIPSSFMAEASKVENKKHITLEQAQEIALKEVNDNTAKITNYDIDLNIKNPCYTIELKTKTHIYKVNINAVTGEKNSFESVKIRADKPENEKRRFIPKDAAKIIALIFTL